MPIEVNEYLSEYSYGYGVTREVEALLRSRGIKTTPFLPSTVKEKYIGADVAFRKPGLNLLVQFKIGQKMMRFVRDDPHHVKPDLDRPFWRFKIDTAKAEGQYDTLLKMQDSGNEVYYIAPMMSEWEEYSYAFERQKILINSLIVEPKSIRDSLLASYTPDGKHKIVYDYSRTYLCSKPHSIRRSRILDLVEKREEAAQRFQSLSDSLKVLYECLDEDRSMRDAEYFGEGKEDIQADAQNSDHSMDSRSQDRTRISPEFENQYTENLRRIRRARERRNNLFERVYEQTDSIDMARYVTIGTVAWSMGAQLLSVNFE